MGVALAVVGAVTSYQAQRDQAKAMEYQAQAARQQAEYNATVQQQNALSEEQVANFRALGEERKKTDALIALERTLETSKRKDLYSLGKLKNQGAYMGADFDFVLESGMQDMFSQEVETYVEASRAGAQYTAQADEFRRQGAAALSAGFTKADMTIMAGNNRANDLENAASTTRTNALGNLASGLAEASQMEN
jgi:hypothetical protein